MFIMLAYKINHLEYFMPKGHVSAMIKVFVGLRDMTIHITKIIYSSILKILSYYYRYSKMLDIMSSSQMFLTIKTTKKGFTISTLNFAS